MTNTHHQVAEALFDKFWRCFDREDYDSALQAATSLLVNIIEYADDPDKLAAEIARKLPRWVMQAGNGSIDLKVH